MPPVQEQRDILERIGRESDDVNLGINRTRRKTELPEGYRIRLIADVVTGKLAVRDAAAQLSDDADYRESMGENVHGLITQRHHVRLAPRLVPRGGDRPCACL